MRFYRFFSVALFLTLPFIAFSQVAEQPAPSPTPVVDGEDDEESSMGAFFDGMGIGASYGLSLYYGDLAEYDIFPKPRDFKDYFRSGWRVYAMRDIKWGLGARVQFVKGSLEGGRQPGPQSYHVSMRNVYHGFDVGINYSLDRLLFDRSKANSRRIWIDGNIGVGITWFRSYQFNTETRHLRESYFGYTVPEGTEALTVNVLDDRAKMASATSMPIGVTFGYRLNYKTDLTFTISQTNVLSDNFDAWQRSWSARDKYGYFGIGLKFNFNREEGDFTPNKIGGNSRGDGMTDNAAGAGSGPNDIDVDSDFRSDRTMDLGKKNRRRNNGSNDDELLNVRLKLFEIQMKLFEMEYLLKDF